MPTVFTRIINGEFPGTFVHRDEQCVAFMSINPLARGHVLVVPIEEVDHWVDASPHLAAHLFAVTHRIARAQRDAFSCARVGVIVAGYEVPHAHIHVILEAAAQAIRSQL
jgi:histidine triad (HIT) family protein